MTAVTIIDPCDIWAEGVAAVMSAAGYHVTFAEAFDPTALATNELALVAVTMLPIEMRGSPSCVVSSPIPTVAILHANDVMSLPEFMASPITGLLLSTATRESVLDCLRSVKRGERWVDPHFATRPCPVSAEGHSWEGLSKREEEVARLAAEGLSNKHIARALNLSDGTIKIHVHNILSKLGYDRRRQLSFDQPDTPAEQIHP